MAQVAHIYTDWPPITIVQLTCRQDEIDRFLSLGVAEGTIVENSGVSKP